MEKVNKNYLGNIFELSKIGQDYSSGQNQKIQKATEEIKKSIKIRRGKLTEQNEFNPTEFFNLSFYINYMECVLYWINHKDFDEKYWNCLNYLKYLYREYKNSEFNLDFFFSKDLLSQVIEN